MFTLAATYLCQFEKQYTQPLTSIPKSS